MGKFIDKHQMVSVALSDVDIYRLVGHSLTLGIVLFFITILCARLKYGKQRDRYENMIVYKGVVASSFNLIYLSVGLTIVMILVNNNLARAFSIGAAIALIRFRTKLETNDLSHAILFAIIAGIACGLDEITIAWLLAGIYTIVSLFQSYFNNHMSLKLEGIRNDCRKQ
ncbi:MAG: hypothetical protein COW00_04230 [Bdellovibrio sp. CG12_big_fil_rev_8_21_14_0_65_39_13]|nr:MAG: hypothetical protein COW78_20360 [Bdellovibrio sp. CG22_combo_CG10-13_8_21_14_all_39_27]PIQ61320.1 MAG: hypothetical protein COW00_04230 [Bdellovibrio sp. CG12_big_fil_rev_8_21_14_0_65_39_13]PIR33630.1 MAG: hypothetical protein COV37_15875 [Bdellovibrio sp. CG11_big_fil_rev_8_21_14_0_20_39_38]PJB53745.1 MAG: hypothetical protein CO099_05415 [Bdellovibrio sp. CG_4_9_14_3_um_filter_39_7]